MSTLAFYNFSGWELLIIGVIALLVFGKRLPEVGRSLGKGIVEFKKGLKDIETEVQNPPAQQPAQYRAPLSAQPAPAGTVSQKEAVEEHQAQQ